MSQAMVALGANGRNSWHVSAGAVDLTRGGLPPRAVTVEDRGRKITLDLARTAIVVVDMQNDFCHPEGWLAHIGVDVTPARAPIAPLQRLLPVLRGADVPVVWLNWGNRADRANLAPSTLHVYNPDGRSNGIGAPLPARPDTRVLEKGSWSAAVVDELAPESGDLQIDKYAMSGFQNSVLDAVLRNLGLTTLLFAGVNSDQCVLATLMEANFRGYDCLLLEDCAATTSPDFCREATLYNIRQCFGFVISSQDLLAAMHKDTP